MSIDVCYLLSGIEHIQAPGDSRRQARRYSTSAPAFKKRLKSFVTKRPDHIAFVLTRNSQLTTQQPRQVEDERDGPVS